MQQCCKNKSSIGENKEFGGREKIFMLRKQKKLEFCFKSFLETNFELVNTKLL